MYMYYGIQSHFYNTQHTDCDDHVRMHVYMHLVFKELMYRQILWNGAPPSPQVLFLFCSYGPAVSGMHLPIVVPWGG